MQPSPVKMNSFEKIQMYLFDTPDNIPDYHKLTPTEEKIKDRYANTFTYWINNPTLSENKVNVYIQNTFGLSYTAAFRDIHKIKILLGNVQNASKEWQRYKVIAILDKAFALAEKRKDQKSMILAADKLAKYTQLDKPETQKIPYDEIVPQNFEITGDVTVLGIEPISNLREKQKKLRDHLSTGIIEDAKIISKNG